MKPQPFAKVTIWYQLISHLAWVITLSGSPAPPNLVRIRWAVETPHVRILWLFQVYLSICGRTFWCFFSFLIPTIFQAIAYDSPVKKLGLSAIGPERFVLASGFYIVWFIIDVIALVATSTATLMYEDVPLTPNNTASWSSAWRSESTHSLCYISNNTKPITRLCDGRLWRHS